MRASLLLSFCLVAGCLPRVGPLLGEPDAGVLPEHCSDGTMNEGETATDCGGACAGCAVGAACAGPADCAAGVCTALACVAPASVCKPAYGGCSSYTDATANDHPRTIKFPIGGLMFSPNCLRVKLGQTVTFMSPDSTFTSHPLKHGCGPTDGLIMASAGNSKPVVFNVAVGRYGFYCDEHGTKGGDGMAGGIEVVP